MNSQLLQESSTVIVDKTICANTVNTQEIVYIIEKYLLCASNNMNDVGQEPRVENETNKDCTVRRYDLTRATDNNGVSIKKLYVIIYILYAITWSSPCKNIKK